jgi:transposase
VEYYIINKSYKFRIYPNKEQESFLNQTFGCCRFVVNKMVACFLDGVLPKEKPSVKMLREEFE